MKITLCGSVAIYDKMVDLQKQLDSLGHQVKLPPSEFKNEKGEIISVQEYYRLRQNASEDDTWIWDRKEEAMRIHFDKVTWADSILAVNVDKGEQKNYIGPNTLMELGLAFYQSKKIYLLQPIPEVSYKEEILGMKPAVINGDLSLVK